MIIHYNLKLNVYYMGKSRMMGAGNACASVRINGNTGGGNKKQGLTSTVGKQSNVQYNRSIGTNRDALFYMNQLGGIGRLKSMFITGSGGIKNRFFGVTESFHPIYGSSGCGNIIDHCGNIFDETGCKSSYVKRSCDYNTGHIRYHCAWKEGACTEGGKCGECS